MYSITAHDKQQPTYVDDASSGSGRVIPKNAITSELQALGATLKFIDCWLKHFQHNYQLRLITYLGSMIKLFKQIPNMKYKPLIQDKKDQFLWSDIGGAWYIKNYD